MKRRYVDLLINRKYVFLLFEWPTTKGILVKVGTGIIYTIMYILSLVGITRKISKGGYKVVQLGISVKGR